MTIGKHKKTWAGKPIIEWEPEKTIDDPVGSAYSLRIEYDSGVVFSELFANLLADPRSEELTALVIGAWDDELFEVEPTMVVEALTAAADRLPNLTSIFLGDITFEENEISWIRQADVSPLLGAYPKLEHFGARGGNGLVLGQFSLPQLRSLVIETGGMPLNLAQEALSAELPALEHLELWLGAENYGGSVTIEALAPLFDHPERWPKLTYLGLRDSEIADEIAEVIVKSPILAQLTELDLSLGILGNQGAKALVESPAVTQLKKLTLHHHYISEDYVALLKALSIEVDASDPQDGDPWDKEDRYVSVSE